MLFAAALIALGGSAGRAQAVASGMGAASGTAAGTGAGTAAGADQRTAAAAGDRAGDRTGDHGAGPAAAPVTAPDTRTEKQKALALETERLFDMATELKAQVDKTNKNILSLKVVEKAEEIEALAKGIRAQAKK